MVGGVGRSAAGEVVAETFDYDGGRQVTVYVPAEPPEAVVFAGDGQLISRWGGVLEAAGVPPAMIVGTHRLDDEMLRLGSGYPTPAPPTRAYSPCSPTSPSALTAHSKRH